MSGSALYVGRVRHRRFGDLERSFAYRVWYALLDLDELPELAARIPILSHNRFNLTGFDDCDHLRPVRRPVRAKLEEWLAVQSGAPPSGPILLLTHLRVLGGVFNPVSFFYCYDSELRLREVVAEVNNTFGETYCYRLPHDGGPGVVSSEQDKAFHVSPFQPLDGRYRFRVTPPGDRLTIHLDVVRSGARAFDATLTLDRRPLTTGSLLATVLRHPHVGVRNLALIHYQALRLLLRRAPFFSKPEPPLTAWRTRHG